MGDPPLSLRCLQEQGGDVDFDRSLRQKVESKSPPCRKKRGKDGHPTGDISQSRLKITIGQAPPRPFA